MEGFEIWEVGGGKKPLEQDIGKSLQFYCQEISMGLSHKVTKKLTQFEGHFIFILMGILIKKEASLLKTLYKFGYHLLGIGWCVMPYFVWASQKVQEFEVVEDGTLRWNLLVGFHKTFPSIFIC